MQFKICHRGRHPLARVARVSAPGNRTGFVLPNGDRIRKSRPRLVDESYVLQHLELFCNGITRGVIEVSQSGLVYSVAMLRQLKDSLSLLNDPLEKEVELTEVEQPDVEVVEQEPEVESEENEQATTNEDDEVVFVDEEYFARFSRSRLNRMARDEYGISNPSQFSSKSSLITEILTKLESVEG